MIYRRGAKLFLGKVGLERMIFKRVRASAFIQKAHAGVAQIANPIKENKAFFRNPIHTVKLRLIFLSAHLCYSLLLYRLGGTLTERYSG